MRRVKEGQGAAYSVQRKAGRRVDAKRSFRHFLFDGSGRRIGVQLDVKSYEQLLKAKEELAEIRAFDESVGVALDSYKKGDFMTLDEYKRHRKSRPR